MGPLIKGRGILITGKLGPLTFGIQKRLPTFKAAGGEGGAGGRDPPPCRPSPLGRVGSGRFSLHLEEVGLWVLVGSQAGAGERWGGREHPGSDARAALLAAPCEEGLRAVP